MKKKYFYFLYILLVSFLLIPQTLGKYIDTSYGQAGILMFNNIKIITNTFYLEDDAFIDDDGNLKDYVEDIDKWGTNSEDKTKDYGLDSLSNIAFPIKNNSGYDVLVTFYVSFKMGNVAGWTSKFNLTVKNVTTGESLTGDVPFTKDAEPIEGSWFLNYKYLYHATINPMEHFTSTPSYMDIVENSFVIRHDNTALNEAMFNLTINYDAGFGGAIEDLLVGGNVYISVKLIAVRYPLN